MHDHRALVTPVCAVTAHLSFEVLLPLRIELELKRKETLA
jgi:hypothetical protein